MTKLNNEICELNVQELDRVNGGYVPPQLAQRREAEIEKLRERTALQDYLAKLYKDAHNHFL